MMRLIIRWKRESGNWGKKFNHCRNVKRTRIERFTHLMKLLNFLTRRKETLSCILKPNELVRLSAPSLNNALSHSSQWLKQLYYSWKFVVSSDTLAAYCMMLDFKHLFRTYSVELKSFATDFGSWMYRINEIIYFLFVFLRVVFFYFEKVKRLWKVFLMYRFRWRSSSSA